MSYYNYHAHVKKLIKEGKLKKWIIVPNYKGISPALLLFFEDGKHPIMPIRKHRFEEYLEIISSLK